MADAGGAGARRLGAAVALWALLLALGALLGNAVWSLPPDAASLADAALRHLDRSGVEHAVTAVLMNYRAYDTLLEIAVLFLATLGVWSTDIMPQRPAAPPGLVLEFLNQLLVPFLILFAGYLLWAGATEPGGAFQAGAVLAAAGVLATLSGTPLPAVPPPLHRGVLLLGLVAFLVAGAGTMVAGRAFLEFPPQAAKAVILAIEACASVAIASCLIAIFRGGRPAVPGRTPR